MSELKLFPGTSVEYYATGNDRIDYIINKLMISLLIEYMQIRIHYETGFLIQEDVKRNTYRFSYQHWNKGCNAEIYLNGNDIALKKELYEIDYENGLVSLKFDIMPGDIVMASYNFNYFPSFLLEGYIERSLGTVNTAGEGAISNYTIDTAPVEYDSIIADLSLAQCFEKLILDYDIWKGRLIYAISPEGIYSGSDNIISQLELLKRNCEDRAYKSLDNPLFRNKPMLKKPTRAYYQSILFGAGLRVGEHGGFYGKTRGMKINQGIFRTGGSLDV